MKAPEAPGVPELRQPAELTLEDRRLLHQSLQRRHEPDCFELLRHLGDAEG